MFRSHPYREDGYVEIGSRLTKILDYHLVEFVTNTCYIAGNFWNCYYGGERYGYITVPGMFYNQVWTDEDSVWVGSTH